MSSTCIKKLCSLFIELTKDLKVSLHAPRILLKTHWIHLIHVIVIFSKVVTDLYFLSVFIYLKMIFQFNY